MQHSSTPWWMADAYTRDYPLPQEMTYLAGPKGPALVRAWPSGVTDQGWGINPPKGSEEGFMPRYSRGAFDQRKVLFGYEHDRHAFAIVMRSVRLMCIDIDGKNGGLEHAKRLGALPVTLAETSKSGNGYHLFYIVNEEWDPVTGFGSFSDRIGIEQGVDIRATGCVYHHKQQRWNGRPAVHLPPHLATLLKARDQKVAASNERISKVLAGEDRMEVLMMHEGLISELKKPIDLGKRNNTLFAIGSQMCLAQVPDWETAVSERAGQVGLDAEEIDKLIANIQRYGTQQAQTP